MLGWWANGNEGVKYWMAVLMNLKNRRMKDAFVICTDGLKGFPEAIEAVSTSTLVQTCIVHLIRASRQFVNWKSQAPGRRRRVGAQLAARNPVLRFSGRDPQYPRYDQCGGVTANVAESLHMTLRNVTTNRGSFLSQKAAIKLIYPALRNVSTKWHTVQGWRNALRKLAFVGPNGLNRLEAV